MPHPKEDPSGVLPLSRHPIEERHLEAALDYIAHIMLTQGEVYAPIYDRLEEELEALQKRRGPIERARLRLEARTTTRAKLTPRSA